MLIEWLWKYEYFVNLWNILESVKYYLIHGYNVVFVHNWPVDFITPQKKKNQTEKHFSAWHSH